MLHRGRYYRRSVRVGGQVQTEYVGVTLADEFQAEQDRKSRERKQARVEASADRRARLVAAARGRATAILVCEVLGALGWHRPGRHRWKRRRRRKSMMALPAPEHTTEAAVRDLVKRYRAGDQQALRAIREHADVNPAAVARAVVSDLGQLARETWIDQKLNTVPVMAIGVEARLAVMARQLAGANPSIARLLAVEAVLFAYLEHWQVSLQAAAAPSAEMSRTQNAAQARYFRALKTFTAIAAVEGWNQTVDVDAAASFLDPWPPPTAELADDQR
jgi:hypothetical protein